MIDPATITDYTFSWYKKEQQIIFWILAAGKNGTVTARLMNNLFKTIDPEDCMYPFDAILKVGEEKLPLLLKQHGIGCYTLKARSIWELITSNIDLFTCTPEDLEKIFGIGMKTSRCFILHSRKNAKYAGLDTHMLKYLKSRGHTVPKITPTGKKYSELEHLVLKYAEESGKTPAEFDLDVWNSYKVGDLKNTPVAQR